MIQGKKVTGMRYREELPFRTVFVSPFDMNLLYFAPSHRREYIDSILSRTFSQFSKVKREYDQTMRERNALLKSIRECVAQREDLTYWNKSFAQKAELYMLYRKKWIDFTKKHDEKVSKFLQKYTLTFFYETRLDIENGHFEEQIFTYLEEHTERDILS